MSFVIRRLAATAAHNIHGNTCRNITAEAPKYYNSLAADTMLSFTALLLRCVVRLSMMYFGCTTARPTRCMLVPWPQIIVVSEWD